MAIIKVDYGELTGGGIDILNWQYVDKITSPTFYGTTSWNYTFDFSTYKYFFVVNEFDVSNYYFFDGNNIAQKVTNEVATYPVTVTQNGNTITFNQPVTANSNVFIYRFTV